MNRLQKCSAVLLILVASVSLAGIWIAPDYVTQNRDSIQQPPSANSSWALINSAATTSHDCSRDCACPCSWPRRRRSHAHCADFGALSGFAAASSKRCCSVASGGGLRSLAVSVSCRPRLLPLNVSPSASI